MPVRVSLASCDGHPPGSGLSPPGRCRSPTDVLSSRLSSGISAFQPLTADQRPQATGRTSATHLCKFQHRPRGTFPPAFPPSRRTPKARGGFIGATAAPTFSRGPVLEADSRHKSESRLRTREVTPRKPGRGIGTETGKGRSKRHIVSPLSTGTKLSRGAGGAPRQGARCLSTHTLSLAEGHAWTRMLRPALPKGSARRGRLRPAAGSSGLSHGVTQRASGLGVPATGS